MERNPNQAFQGGTLFSAVQSIADFGRSRMSTLLRWASGPNGPVTLLLPLVERVGFKFRESGENNRGNGRG